MDLNTDVLLDQLWKPIDDDEVTHTYVVLDGARDEKIYSKMVSSNNEYSCLYRGELEYDLAAAAPYLIRLMRDDLFTASLIAEGWGKSWGVFVKSAASLNELRRHFRKFLMVYDENGKPLYFRYYDPRVLRVYLPTCNQTELGIVFGPVARYLVEAEDPNVILQYSYQDGKLCERRVKLDRAGELTQ